MPTSRVLTEEILAEITRRLASALSLKAIYLFGSHAYGTPRADSDIDLLLVCDDASQLDIAGRTRLHLSLRGLFLPIELHLRSAPDFARLGAIPASLEHEVLTKGRVLYAA